MIFSLSKKVFENGSRKGYISSGHNSVYELFRDGELRGQFVLSPKECFFSWEGGRRDIRIRRGFFPIHRESIHDERTGETPGHFGMMRWTIFIGYRSKLLYDGISWSFESRRPDIRYSLFKKSTWGHYSFSLSNGSEKIIYAFKIDYQSPGRVSVELPFEGTVDSNSLNIPIPVVLAGLFLVERALEMKSSS